MAEAHCDVSFSCRQLVSNAVCWHGQVREALAELELPYELVSCGKGSRNRRALLRKQLNQVGSYRGRKEMRSER